MPVSCPKCQAQLELSGVPPSGRVKCPACGTRLGVRSRQRRCPMCNSRVGPNDSLCPSCGCAVDLRKFRMGRGITSSHDDADRPSPLAMPLLVLARRLPGLFRPKTLVATLVVLAVAGGAVFAAQMLVQHSTLTFLSLPTLAIFVFACVVYMQAIAMLIGGDVCSLPSALSDFDGMDWCVFFSLLLVPIALLVSRA